MADFDCRHIVCRMRKIFIRPCPDCGDNPICNVDTNEGL